MERREFLAKATAAGLASVGGGALMAIISAVKNALGKK